MGWLQGSCGHAQILKSSPAGQILDIKTRHEDTSRVERRQYGHWTAEPIAETKDPVRQDSRGEAMRVACEHIGGGQRDAPGTNEIVEMSTLGK